MRALCRGQHHLRSQQDARALKGAVHVDGDRLVVMRIGGLPRHNGRLNRSGRELGLRASRISRSPTACGAENQTGRERGLDLHSPRRFAFAQTHDSDYQTARYFWSRARALDLATASESLPFASLQAALIAPSMTAST